METIIAETLELFDQVIDEVSAQLPALFP